MKNIIKMPFFIWKKIWGWNWKYKLGLLLIIVVAGWYGWRQYQSQTATPTYSFYQVKGGDVTQIVSETGEITADNKTAVVSSVEGIVSDVYASNGSSVKRGDKLFYVKSTATDSERSTALAAYQSAKATLEQAQASQYSLQSKMFTDWDVYMKTTDKDTYEDPNALARNVPEFQTDQKDWLAAEANYKAQAQVVAKAKSTLNQAWLDYQAKVDAPVKATADGTVANLAVTIGQQVNTEDTALVIKNAGQPQVKVAFSEHDIVQIQPGQSAIVTIDALKGVEFSARVERVDEFATVESDVVTYNVYLTMDSTDALLKPGMTAQVEITTQEKKGILVIPESTIKPYQGQKAVQILDESGTAKYQVVKLGISDDNNVEVLEGLTEGQQIINGSVSSDSEESNGGGMIFGGGPR